MLDYDGTLATASSRARTRRPSQRARDALRAVAMLGEHRSSWCRAGRFKQLAEFLRGIPIDLVGEAWVGRADGGRKSAANIRCLRLLRRDSDSRIAPRRRAVGRGISRSSAPPSCCTPPAWRSRRRARWSSTAASCGRDSSSATGCGSKPLTAGLELRATQRGKGTMVGDPAARNRATRCRVLGRRLGDEHAFPRAASAGRHDSDWQTSPAHGR